MIIRGRTCGRRDDCRDRLSARRSLWRRGDRRRRLLCHAGRHASCFDKTLSQISNASPACGPPSTNQRNAACSFSSQAESSSKLSNLNLEPSERSIEIIGLAISFTVYLDGTNRSIPLTLRLGGRRCAFSRNGRASRRRWSNRRRKLLRGGCISAVTCWSAQAT
jgi:hypothetical protein